MNDKIDSLEKIRIQYKKIPELQLSIYKKKRDLENQCKNKPNQIFNWSSRTLSNEKRFKIIEIWKKGRIANLINTSNDKIITEMIYEGFLSSNMSPQIIASQLSIFLVMEELKKKMKKEI